MSFSSEVQDPRFQPRPAGPRHIPLGRYPIPSGRRFRTVQCVHCEKPLGISSWDYIHGFLVLCPHCSGFHGKPWGLERPLLAGLFLNALSFFFLMRPRRALAALALFVAIGGALVYVAGQNEQNDALMIGSVSFVLLGPVLVNAVLLVRHQMRLDKSPPVDPGGLEI